MLDVDGSVELAERDEVIGLGPAFLPPRQQPLRRMAFPAQEEIGRQLRAVDHLIRRTPRSVRASPSSALTTACEASSRQPEATLICVIPGAVAVGRYMHSMAPIFWQPVQELEGLKR
jgi:hypothetical protein